MYLKLHLFRKRVRLIFCRASKKIKNELIDESLIQTKSYYHKMVYTHGREVFNIKYDTMKEIVNYVYYNYPDSPMYNHYLVVKDNRTGKEYEIKLAHNKNFSHEQNQGILSRTNYRGYAEQNCL